MTRSTATSFSIVADLHRIEERQKLNLGVQFFLTILLLGTYTRSYEIHKNIFFDDI